MTKLNRRIRKRTTPYTASDDTTIHIGPRDADTVTGQSRLDLNVIHIKVGRIGNGRMGHRSRRSVSMCQGPFNAQVIAVSDTAMVLALPSDEKKINGLVQMLKPIGIIEMSRSGQIAVTSPE